MKISLNWLQDFITLTETDPQKIADRITTGIAEVDDVQVQGALLDHCCVGRVISVARHPKADRLSVCDVETDKGIKRVVCGGTNVREGMCVAFAHSGATVKWHGGDVMTLEKASIRGEESDGMICAAEELELEALFPPMPEHGERPVIELNGYENQVSMPLKEALGLDDVVLHIDNHAITHRADLFSHTGFAREFVALGLATWKKMPATPKISFPKTALPFKASIDAPEQIYRYCACLLQIDNPGTTPDWMKKRLMATGWRSISLPIDITNYVATEVGMPLHSFDADDFQGDIHMRQARRGESITTLDGVKRELPDGAMVLSDDAGIFDLLGIMGGLRSSTKDTTKKVYLHSAGVDPVRIRKAVIATGHRTDAATVYEKGIPNVTVEQGFLRALELFLELVPGAKIISRKEESGDDGKVQPVILEPGRVNNLLGTDISDQEMKTTLEMLGCNVKSAKGKTKKFTVTPPLWRPKDLQTNADLAEEVGRVHGYNAIEPRMPAAELSLPNRDPRRATLRTTLKDQTFFELVPLSLTGENVLQKAGLDAGDALAVQNPLGEELKLLHTSTLPALLEHAERNRLLAKGPLKTFQLAHVFSATKPEHLQLGMLVTDTKADATNNLKESAFLNVKMSLLAALSKLGYKPVIQALVSTPPFMHPGRAASVYVGDTQVGEIFEVHPEVTARFSLPGRAAAATLHIDALFAGVPAPKIMQPVPLFPDITYDSTHTLKRTQEAGPLLETASKADPLLTGIEIVDMYTGKPLADNEYNLTIRCTYSAAGRTLTEEEARKAHEKVLRLIK